MNEVEKQNSRGKPPIKWINRMVEYWREKDLGKLLEINCTKNNFSNYQLLCSKGRLLKIY